MHIIAAVITAVATLAAAVIAAAASGDDSPDVLRAGPPTTSVTAPPSVTEPTATAGTSGPPVQTLPATDPTTPDSGPRVAVTPDMAAVGDTVTIEAGGFAPGERIRITLRDSGAVEKDLRDVTTDEDGRFVAEVRVPEEVSSGTETPAFRVWSVDDVDSANTADTPFTYIE